MSPRRAGAAWAAATVVGVLLPFAPVVAGLRTLSHRDTHALYAPVRTLVVEELRAGRLPLWNPYEGTGKPLFAEGIHSVLHPVSLLAALLAPSSIDFLILAYLVAAALGAFLLARTLGASPPASTAGGLAFALSGYSVSMTGNLVFLVGLATLPWLLAAAHRAGSGGRWGPVATALATACAFFSGDAQVAIVGLALGLLLAADAGGRRGAARALLGIVPGLLLAAVQIVPTAALIPNTYRALDPEPWERTQWALPPARILEWIVPGLFRGPLDAPPLKAADSMLDAVFAESAYLGAPVVVAAALGAAVLARAGRRRTALLLGGASLVLLWLALGHRLGARQLLDWVPVWSRFRYAEKLMAPLALCACALAALGVDAFGATPLPRWSRRALLAAAAASAAALAALLLLPVETRELATRLVGSAGPFYRSTLAAGLPHLAIAAAALLGADRLLREPSRRATLGLLVALAPAAAVQAGAHLGDPAVRRFTTPMVLEAEPPSPRLFHPLERLLGGDALTAYAEASARTGSILLTPAVNVAHRVDTLGGYGAFEPRRATTLIKSLGADWARDYRRFGLTHVVLQLRRDDPTAGHLSRAIDGGLLAQRDERLGFELWAVPHRRWAFFAERAVAAERPLAARKALLELLARGDDGAVVVEAPAPPPTAPGRVLGVARGTGSASVEAESPGPGLLVVQDAFWPGWRASIDGQPAEILAADFLVRAVRFPPGRHVLEMTYDPPELRVGLALSALGALAVVGLWAVAARRGRRAPPGVVASP